LRESKLKVTDLNAQSKAEGKLKEDYEHRLLAAMKLADTTVIENEAGTFTSSEKLMPHAKDWEAIHEYVKENHAFHLLYRQISPTAYRDLLEAGEEIPGIDSFTKYSISITKSTRSAKSES